MRPVQQRPVQQAEKADREGADAPPPIHARLWLWLVYSLIIIYATISIGTDLTPSLVGLVCVPVVLATLLTARGLVLAVLHVPLDVFLGQHKVLAGAWAWAVPPIAMFGLAGLNELGVVSYSYVSNHYNTHFNSHFQTDNTKPGERWVRMVREDGTTYVAFDLVAKRDEEVGNGRRFVAEDRDGGKLTVHPTTGCHVTDGLRSRLPSLDQLGCAYSGQITVRSPNPSVLGVLRASAEFDVEIEFDVLLWLPNGADTGVRGTSKVQVRAEMVGFASKRAFLTGAGEQLGTSFGNSLLETARRQLEKIQE